MAESEPGTRDQIVTATRKLIAESRTSQRKRSLKPLDVLRERFSATSLAKKNSS